MENIKRDTIDKVYLFSVIGIIIFFIPIKINNINIIIPTIIPTLGITDSDIKEKSRDIVNASIVTIRGQLFLFFFFINFLSNIIKRPEGLTS